MSENKEDFSGRLSTFDIDKINEFLTENNIRNSKAAKVLDVTKQCVGQWTNKRDSMPLDRARQLCRHFGYEIKFTIVKKI